MQSHIGTKSQTRSVLRRGIKQGKNPIAQIPRPPLPKLCQSFLLTLPDVSDVYPSCLPLHLTLPSNFPLCLLHQVHVSDPVLCSTHRPSSALLWGTNINREVIYTKQTHNDLNLFSNVQQLKQTFQAVSSFNAFAWSLYQFTETQVLSLRWTFTLFLTFDLVEQATPGWRYIVGLMAAACVTELFLLGFEEQKLKVVGTL